jgi:hypothetical protein
MTRIDDDDGNEPSVFLSSDYVAVRVTESDSRGRMYI